MFLQPSFFKCVNFKGIYHLVLESGETFCLKEKKITQPNLLNISEF